MTITEFIEDRRLLNDQSLSPAQKMAVKAIYGERMTAEELELFGEASGGRKYAESVEQTEATILKGRKAGGTDKILTNCLLYEVCVRPPKLSVGERAVAQIVTSELRRQSRVVYDYCAAKLQGSPILRKLVKRTTSDEIELTNGTTILIFPCNQARVRAPSILFFGADEVCFWKTEGRSIDSEVLNAARPGLIFPHSKMIKLSSASWMRGEMYQDFKSYYGQDEAPVLVLKGSTEFFFPGFSKTKLAAAKRRDPVAFEAEYGAKFRADQSGMYDPAIIDAAVNTDRPQELAYRRDAGGYVAFVDAAGGGGKDSFAVAIGHLEGQKIIVDVVRSRRPKFNPDEVTAQYADLLRSYGVYSVTGDKFSGDTFLHLFSKHGIALQRAIHPKSQLYLDAEGAFNSGRVDLPAREPLLSQLKSLVRKVRSGNRDSVDTDAGQPEDEANVAAGLIWLLMERCHGAIVDIWWAGEPVTRKEPEIIAESLLHLSDQELEKRLNALSEAELENVAGQLEKRR